MDSRLTPQQDLTTMAAGEACSTKDDGAATATATATASNNAQLHATAASLCGSTTAEAPPKQVSQVMEWPSHAGSLIADIRLGAIRLLEALFVAAQPHQSSKPLHLFLIEA
ncbi:hypothetical protein FF1_014019 [Malus domestica]